MPGYARAVEWGSYAARAWRCSVRHGSLARASAAIGDGLTLLRLVGDVNMLPPSNKEVSSE